MGAGAAGRGRGAADLREPVHTYSIVAHDPESKQWGVGVASRVLAVGSAVPYARANVGAVATQASTNLTWGPKGLELLAQGKSAEEVVKTLTEADKGSAFRQLGVIDAKGTAAACTGKRGGADARRKTGKH